MCDLYSTDECESCETCDEDVENGIGDCYVVHGRHMLNKIYRKTNLILVHGIVVGQGPLEGVEYGHCWLEDTRQGLVHDYSNGRSRTMKIELYYMLGKIKDTDDRVFKYSLDDVREMVLDYEHWGPWDLECER